MTAFGTLSRNSVAHGVASLLVGIVLWFAPPAFTIRLRSLSLDALRPGLLVAECVQNNTQSWHKYWQESQLHTLQTELNSTRSELEKTSARLHGLTARFVSLAEEKSSLATPPSTDALRGSPNLFLPALVETRVIGETSTRAWRSGRILADGHATGIREESLVLQSSKPLVDLGNHDQLTPDDPLLVGNRIVGKIEVVGRWTSTFLPVTDPEFRGAAQLVRWSDDSPAWGAIGVIRGTGSRCELHGISSEAGVRVGDEVFSSDRDGIFDAPLYYGTVVSAELSPNAHEWTIVVEPAASDANLTHVRVLRAALNPRRLWTSLGAH